MITEIIDLIVDASNSFGSLFSFLRMKYKKYDTIIINRSPLEIERVNQLYRAFPNLKNEVDIYKQQFLYVVIGSYTIKKNKCTLTIVLLNEKRKYIHGFSILQKNVIIPDIYIPCYWQV